MKLQKILYIFFLSIVWTFANGQSAAIRKAKKLYKQSRYAKAIPIFESVITESSSLSLKIKLANCYRLTNQMQKAVPIYSQIVADEKAKPIQYYYYGEVLMNNGQYNQARNWLLKYLELEPNNLSAKRKAQSCAYVQQLSPFFKEVKIRPFPMNSDADDTGAVFSGKGIVFSSDRKTGVKLLQKKSGWTGRNFVNLYYSEQISDTSFTAPKLFSKKLAVLNKNTSAASFTKNGKEIFFARNSMKANKNKTFTMQLYSAKSEDGVHWTQVEALPFCSINNNYMHPSVSPDGKLLFFASDKPRGEGGVDIYVSRKIGKTWKRPENLGPNVNTTEHEGFPFLFENGKLFFCSKGHLGYGGFDIFYTEQDSSGVWQKPVNVGAPINSPADDIAFHFSKEKSKGIFTSGRDGGDDDLYFFSTTNIPDYQLANIIDPDEGLPQFYQAVPTPKKDTVKEINSIHKENPDSSVNIVKKENEVTIPEVVLEHIQKTDTPKETEIDDPFMVEEKKNVQTSAIAEDLKKEQKATWIVEEALVKKGRTNQKTEKTATRIKTKTSEKTKTVNTEIWQKEQDSENLLQGSNIARTRRKILNTSKTFSKEYFEEIRTKYTGADNDVGKVFKIIGSYFADDSTEIQQDVAKKLDRLADILKQFPSLDIEIRGHTESLGDNEKNRLLSQHRADAAIQYLVSKGISKNRLNAIGYGEAYLLNNCVDGVDCSHKEHLENQRLEIRVMKF